MLDFTIDLARRAGALLLDGTRRERQVELKSDFEAVTDIDRASEALVVAAIEQHFPEHTILAEERGVIERSDEFAWLVDPLDGTNNYVHGFPYFCVSLGLLKNRRLLLGVVYDPLRDELFAAEAGRGATCNGRPIRVSATADLAAALVSTGFPYDFGTRAANNAPEFARIQARTQGVRRAGAAALDLAYVAIGRLDAHWELDLKPWDMAAGLLLISESGGRISDWRGGPASPWTDRLVASNGRLHDQLIAALGS